MYQKNLSSFLKVNSQQVLFWRKVVQKRTKYGNQKVTAASASVAFASTVAVVGTASGADKSDDKRWW